MNQMLYHEMIKLCTNISEMSPWNYYTKHHNLVFACNNECAAIEIFNNTCNIYLGNNNIYEFQSFRQKMQNLKNFYELEKLRKYGYANIEYVSFSYLYPISLNDAMIKIYQDLKFNLDDNSRYVNLSFKGKGQKITMITKEQVEILLPILKLFQKFLQKTKLLKFENLTDNQVVFCKEENNDIVINVLDKYPVASNLCLPKVEKISCKFNSKKIVKRVLLMDMRYILEEPQDNLYYPLVISSYDDTKEKLLFPTILYEVSLEEITAYLQTIFKKGIYQTIIIYNQELYKILKELLKEYPINILFEETSDIFDCIYDDYEQIIIQNGL